MKTLGAHGCFSQEKARHQLYDVDKSNLDYHLAFVVWKLTFPTVVRRKYGLAAAPDGVPNISCKRHSCVIVFEQSWLLECETICALR